MKLSKLAILLSCIFTLSAQLVHADDQPPTPSQPHSTMHATKLGAALDQPGIPVTISPMQAGTIIGKRHQMVRGMSPVTQDFTLYINGLSVKSTDATIPSVKGLEFKIAYTIKGGNVKIPFVESRFVDQDDIPKLQQFIGTMEEEAVRKTTDDKDHTQGTYTTQGSTSFGFVRDGNKDTDFFVRNAPDTIYNFQFKSGNDIAKLQTMVNDAATWLQKH